jgi:hypothetical protein
VTPVDIGRTSRLGRGVPLRLALAAASGLLVVTLVQAPGGGPGAGARVFVLAALTYAWAAGLVSIGWAAVGRRLPGADQPLDPRTRLVIGGAAVLFGAGLWWGLPGGSWAPDELDPQWIAGGARHWFSGGWSDIYPPLHYYLLTAIYLPAFAADQLRWVAYEDPALVAALYVLGRGFTLALALGTLVALATFADRRSGAGHGWIAALVASLLLPFVYYARTMNVDVPYLFWFSLSLVYFQAALASPAGRGTVGFAVTAALAIATKDQAYGLFVLPVLFLTWHVIRREGGLLTLFRAGVAAALVLAAIYNLWFNSSGFRLHVEAITGGGSEGYRQVPETWTGQLGLLWLTAQQLVWMFGLPGLVLGALAVVSRWRGPSASGRRAAAWLALFPLSYYLTFIAVVGYVYDRFLLPVTLVAAIALAPGVRRLIDGWPSPRVGRLLAGVLLAGLVWRAASVDALQILDSRYRAEAWLRAAAGSDVPVVAPDRSGYMPRFHGLRFSRVEPTIEATLASDAVYIVVNVDFTNRFPADGPVRRWLAWLESGEGPFKEAFRYKSPLTGSALWFWPAFHDRREDPFTNIDKANPEIVIFRKTTPGVVLRNP